MYRLAVIADPHVHDCGWRPSGTGLPDAIRSHAEVALSTRVFNESLPAFRAALNRAVDEGARLVLLVGDLTDDGQAPNIDAALALIDEFRQRHGLRVLATPGNHDLFALAGRPQIKTFCGPDGTPVRVDSAKTPEAATLGAQAALLRMQGLGYMPEPSDLHWETPFGCNHDWSARQHQVASPDGSVHCPMIDASYLVEPVAGLWVLSIDANLCVPRNDAQDLGDPAAFHDPTSAGWRAVLGHRPHLLPWMRDVARRANALGKQLVAFSHYPVTEVLGGTQADERLIFGASAFARRTPPPEVAEAIAATGLRLHFSGHLHVNDTTRYGSFFNIAVPSPVGYGPAMKLAELDGDRVHIRTLPLTRFAGHDLAFARYRTEAAKAGLPAPETASAPDHGSFMDRHLMGLVRNRYMPREWPLELAHLFAQGRLADLTGATFDGSDLPLMELALDWYRLRKAGSLAHDQIAPERLQLYRRICENLPDDDTAPAAFLRILRGYLNRLPDRDFTLDLREMTVKADQGRTDLRQTTCVGNSLIGAGSSLSSRSAM